MRQGYALTTPLQHILANTIRQEKKSKERKKLKLSFFVDDRIIYRVNLKEPTRKLLELTSNYSMAAEYSSYTKSVLYYTPSGKK